MTRIEDRQAAGRERAAAEKAVARHSVFPSQEGEPETKRRPGAERAQERGGEGRREHVLELWETKEVVVFGDQRRSEDPSHLLPLPP